MKSTTTHVVRGALILTVAGLLSKVLSAIYRIPLQNLTGDLGYYTYQQIYPFIGTVMILSLYGFPVAVSKLVAEGRRKGHLITWNQFYFPLFIILLMINGMLFLVIFLGAPYIAHLSGDTSFTNVYRAVAFLFLLIPIVALVRGSFQGLGEMKQTAYSQIMEQIVRVTIIISAAYLIFIGKINVQQIGMAGVLATLIGMLIVTVFLLIIFYKRKVDLKHDGPIYPIPWRHFLITCMTLGIVASLNQLILIFIQFADVLTLVPNLMNYGFSLMEAREWKGIFDRGQPLIQFGVVFGSSFSLALIPAVSQGSIKSTKKYNDRTIQDAISLSFYIASGATVGLIFIMPETNLLLFMNEAGTFSLQVLAISIFITSMSITGSAILLSLGYWKQIIIAILFMFIVKYTLNGLLVSKMGILGSALATITSLLIFLIWIYGKLKTVHWHRSVRWSAVFIAATGMSVYLAVIKWFIYPLFEFSRVGLLCYILFVVFSGAVIYLLLLIRYQAFSNRQISNLPLSSFLLRLKIYLTRKSYWRKK